jgi:hypothetical protein
MIEMIEIEMNVAPDPNELSGRQIRLLRQHQLQGCGGGVVETFPGHPCVTQNREVGTKMAFSPNEFARPGACRAGHPWF